MDKMDARQAQEIWNRASEKVKDRVVAPTLYRALEMGVGIGLDHDEFILGFAGPDLPMAGHLRSSQHQAVIEQVLSQILTKKVRLKIVEGTTPQDYENYKKLQAAANVSRAVLTTRRDQEKAIESGWDDVVEQITRGYSRIHLRAFPQSRAKFLNQAFVLLGKAMEKLDYTDDADEITQRSVARVFDKISTCVEVPSAILAYEFFKLKEQGKV